jgi:hypothetical protein
MRAVTAEQKRQILQLGGDFPRLWAASTTATGFEAKTIHRLLEVDPKTGGFKRGDDNPLVHFLIGNLNYCRLLLM